MAGEGCPSYDGIELENGKVEFGAFTRRVKEIQPPGFDGLLIMHMGKDRRLITVNGIFEGSSGTAISTKVGAMMAKVDTGVHDLVHAGITFKKTRLIDIRFPQTNTVLRDGGPKCDTTYRATFVQLKDDTTGVPSE